MLIQQKQPLSPDHLNDLRSVFQKCAPYYNTKFNNVDRFLYGHILSRIEIEHLDAGFSTISAQFDSQNMDNTEQAKQYLSVIINMLLYTKDVGERIEAIRDKLISKYTLETTIKAALTIIKLALTIILTDDTKEKVVPYLINLFMDSILSTNNIQTLTLKIEQNTPTFLELFIKYCPDQFKLRIKNLLSQPMTNNY
ncbi:MAG: hypothetical protein LRY67_05375, partial [Gammaproteobacteria bacterium]|nr:hypothetical protein [Gammaproteobacteria bacterium]